MSVKPLLNAFRDYISLREEGTTQEWFGGFDWNLSERNLGPQLIPAIELVPEVLEFSKGGELRLAETFVKMRNQLQWIQSYTADDFGQYMVDNYGFVELIGTRGHFVSNDIAAGFVFFGRGIEYPNHWHDSEAFYYPLTGTGLWSQDNGPYESKRAGEFVFHESNEHHALKAPDAPLLALYAWRGGDLAEKGNY